MKRIAIGLLISALVVSALMIIYFQAFYLGEKRPLIGLWEATWSTPPDSIEGSSYFTSFEMKGTYDFSKDSVTAVLMGHPGCVFGVDTLTNTQAWGLKDNLLELYSQDGTVGLSFRVNKISSSSVELQLLDDIFISLQRLQ